MPEISLFLFDLKQLLQLFPKENKELKAKIMDYETKTQETMALNREKLFGYHSEIETAL